MDRLDAGHLRRLTGNTIALARLGERSAASDTNKVPVHASGAKATKGTP